MKSLFKILKIANLVLLTLTVVFLLSCKASSTKETEINDLFDPAVPGGDVSNGSRLPKVLNLQVVIGSDSKRTLTWTLPSTYVGQDYKIHVFRMVGDGVLVPLPDPADTYSTAYLYYVSNPFTPFTTSTYIDATPLLAETNYTYYVFVKVGDKWSSEVKSTITTPAYSATIDIPTATEFWPRYTNAIGNAPLGGALFVNTLSPGAPSIGNPTGMCAFAEDGGILYCPDTQNNRVMIYVSESYTACKDYDKTSIDYEICKAIYNGYPVSPIAVIGQGSFTTSYPCGHGSNPLNSEDCLTSPRSVSIANNKLVISDSGNDRIKIYSNLPTYGCFHVLNFMGQTTPEECTPYKVIGKDGLGDLTNYSVATDGISSLDNPTGTLYVGTDLYIADTGNHRVVAAKNIFDDEEFNCVPGSFKTATCRFNAVLGQESYLTKKTFAEEYSLGNITYNTGTSTLSDSGAFLKRHFANPTEIFTKDAKLIVVSNESFRDSLSSPTLNLYSRIAVFNTDPIATSSPICNSGNFNTVACEANYFIGQTSASSLIELGSLDSYSDVPFAIKDVDITFLGDYMFGVEKETNQVKIWNSYLDSSPGDGVPYSTIVNNPAGVYDSGTSRNLPNLTQLTSVDIVGVTGSLYVFDAGLGQIFEIPLATF